jgi:hypothetical protein
MSSASESFPRLPDQAREIIRTRYYSLHTEPA